MALAYAQDQKMRKFHNKVFTQEEQERIEYDVDTESSLSYHWHFSLDGKKYVQTYEKDTKKIIIK